MEQYFLCPMTKKDFLQEMIHQFPKCPIHDLEDELLHYSEKGDNIKEIETALDLVKRHEEDIRTVRQKIEQAIRKKRINEWIQSAASAETL